jgi:hypothetical protein
MNGKRTCIILGAGASRCYARGQGEMPLQSDLLAKLFLGWTTSGQITVGALAMDHGLRHSTRLGNYLRSQFGLPATVDTESHLQFWKDLQDRRYSLETIYAELEQRATGEDAWAIEEFEAIVRSVIASTAKRTSEGVCDHHRRLVSGFEPGDYVVNFNWDTLISDCLYHQSRLWFPSTGFGPRVGVLSEVQQDLVAGDSMVSVLHIHGCVALYAVVTREGEHKRAIVYIPPDGYNSASSMIQNLRLPEHDAPDGRSGAMRDATAEESARFDAGWILVPSGPWLKPLFVPPSAGKPHYQHWYHRWIVRLLHSNLPTTKHFVLAGYSIPPADVKYVRSLFVPEVIDAAAELSIVNPENDNADYRSRVSEMFPAVAAKDYSIKSFTDFCQQFERDKNRPFRDGDTGG